MNKPTIFVGTVAMWLAHMPPASESVVHTFKYRWHHSNGT
jgi:hypothetical protein